MVDTIGILYRDEDIDKYKQGDFRITSYRTGCPLSTLAASGCADEDPAVYTAVSGKLLDFSINGAASTALEPICAAQQRCNPVLDLTSLAFLTTMYFPGGQMTHNNAANAKAYGAWVTPDDILSGRVDAPADMAALYDQLKELSHSGVLSA